MTDQEILELTSAEGLTLPETMAETHTLLQQISRVLPMNTGEQRALKDEIQRAAMAHFESFQTVTPPPDAGRAIWQRIENIRGASLGQW